MQDADIVAPDYNGKTIYAKVGSIYGGARGKKPTNEAQLKQYEKAQQQLLKEIQRQKEANLKNEQNNKNIDEKIEVEHIRRCRQLPGLGLVSLS